MCVSKTNAGWCHRCFSKDDLRNGTYVGLLTNADHPPFPYLVYHGTPRRVRDVGLSAERQPWWRHAEMLGTYKDGRQLYTGRSCCNGQTADDRDGDCHPTNGCVEDDGWWQARVRPGPSGFRHRPANQGAGEAVRRLLP
jgi:hypothetical protein